MCNIIKVNNYYILRKVENCNFMRNKISDK